MLKVFLGLVFIGIIIFAYLVFTNPDNVQVPNVVGQELSTAQTKIEGAGFKVGEVKEVEDDSVDTGKVIKTDPTACLLYTSVGWQYHRCRDTIYGSIVIHT